MSKIQILENDNPQYLVGIIDVEFTNNTESTVYINEMFMPSKGKVTLNGKVIGRFGGETTGYAYIPVQSSKTIRMQMLIRSLKVARKDIIGSEVQFDGSYWTVYEDKPGFATENGLEKIKTEMMTINDQTIVENMSK